MSVDYKMGSEAGNRAVGVFLSKTKRNVLKLDTLEKLKEYYDTEMKLLEGTFPNIMNHVSQVYINDQCNRIAKFHKFEW